MWIILVQLLLQWVCHISLRTRPHPPQTHLVSKSSLLNEYLKNSFCDYLSTCLWTQKKPKKFGKLLSHDLNAKPRNMSLECLLYFPFKYWIRKYYNSVKSVCRPFVHEMQFYSQFKFGHMMASIRLFMQHS